MADSLQTSNDSRSTFLLQGRLYTVVRVTWLLIAILSIGLSLVAVPFRYQELLDICVGSGCAFGQLSPAEVLALENMGISPGLHATYHITLAIILLLAYVSIAFVIFWHRSRGWLALLLALWLITFVTNNETTLALAESQPLLQGVINFLGQMGWALLLPLFLLVFPDGRFTPRWTRWLFAFYFSVGLVSIAIESFSPNLAFGEMLGAVAWASMHLIGVGAQVYRYMRISNATQRQQTKWLVFGLVATVLILFIFSVVSAFSSPGPLSQAVETTVLSMAFLIIPVSLAISILRYRLWDIDRVINRTLVYGSLTAGLALIYLGSVVLLQSLFTSISDQGSPVSIVISTLVIAALFIPLRRRLQNFVDRRFYRRKYNAEKTLAAFTEVARDEVDMDQLTAELLRVVEKTMQPESVSLWLKEIRIHNPQK